MRTESATIQRLADRLAELRRPVNSRGVVLTLDLLTNAGGASPLYDRSQRDRLRRSLLSGSRHSRSSADVDLAAVAMTGLCLLVAMAIIYLFAKI